MKKEYSKEELEALTMKGRDGEKSLNQIAADHSIDTNGLNKDPLISEILKAQKKSAGEQSETDDSADKSTNSPGNSDSENEWNDPQEKSDKFVEDEKTRTDDPADELTGDEYPRIDEEKAAAARFVPEDKEVQKFVDDGILPDRINTRAGDQGVAPVEIARQVAAAWNAPVEERIAEADAAGEKAAENTSEDAPADVKESAKATGDDAEK